MATLITLNAMSPSGVCKVCGSTERNLNGKRSGTRCANCDRQRHPHKHNACIRCGMLCLKKFCATCRRLENREREAIRMRYWRHHLTDSEYLALLGSQNGKCAICYRQLATPHIDHDHTCCSGQVSCGQCVRGVLCPNCNKGVGSFKDSAENLVSAAIYVSEHRRGAERWYISGPMRGQPNYGFPAFDRAAAMLRTEGKFVVSPADKDRAAGLDETTAQVDEEFVRRALKWDAAILLTCDGAYFLRGYEKSQGARMEHALAVAFGLQRRYEVPKDESQFLYLPDVAIPKGAA